MNSFFLNLETFVKKKRNLVIFSTAYEITRCYERWYKFCSQDIFQKLVGLILSNNIDLF